MSHETSSLSPVLISALEHWSYCPRQCALIHIEQVWDENLYTLRGRMLHEKVDVPDEETAEGVRICRGVPLWSDRLGLVGKADVVEFHRTRRESGDAGESTGAGSGDARTTRDPPIAQETVGHSLGEWPCTRG